MWVVGVDGGARGVEAGGACPRSISAWTSCCRIYPESVGLVLDMGADTGVKWLRSSMGCISMVLTCCGRYWNGLGERAGESGMCTKVLVLMGVGAVGGLVGWLGWKLVWCFWFLHAYTYVSSQCIMGNLMGMSRHGHLFQ